MSFLGGHRSRFNGADDISSKDKAFIEGLWTIERSGINYGEGYRGRRAEPGDIVVLGRYHIYVCGGSQAELAEMKKCASQGLRNLYRVV